MLNPIDRDVKEPREVKRESIGRLSMGWGSVRTDARWRDLPPAYGDWKPPPRRFCRGRKAGSGERLLEQLMTEPASTIADHRSPLY